MINLVCLPVAWTSFMWFLTIFVTWNCSLECSHVLLLTASWTGPSVHINKPWLLGFCVYFRGSQFEHCLQVVRSSSWWKAELWHLWVLAIDIHSIQTRLHKYKSTLISPEKFQMCLMSLSFTLLKPLPSRGKEPSVTVPSNALRVLSHSEVT